MSVADEPEQNEVEVTKEKRPVLHTGYQQWLDQALREQEMTLAQLGRAINKDYNHVWKIGRGNPYKEGSKIQARPGYGTALAIGEAVHDVAGSLKAAGYPDPSTTTSSGHRKVILGYIGSEPVELAVPQQASDDDITKFRALAAITLLERGFTTEIEPRR